jgi:hypothetical protein
MNIPAPVMSNQSRHLMAANHLLEADRSGRLYLGQPAAAADQDQLC